MTLHAVLNNPIFSIDAIRRCDTSRFTTIDTLRGLNVLSMIGWHFLYDLALFQVIQPQFYLRADMQFWRTTIIGLFAFLFGLSVELSSHRGIAWRSYLRRTLRLALTAALISVATMVAFGSQWVYFGIFHFFTLASLLVLPFIGRPLLSLLAGSAILIHHYGLSGPQFLARFLVETLQMNAYTHELIPLVPWLGYALLGLSAFHLRLHERIQLPYSPRPLLYMGQHSILLYLVHLPVLFGLVGGWTMLTR